MWGTMLKTRTDAGPAADALRKLSEKHSLSLEEYALLIENRDALAEPASKLADAARRRFYGNTVFVRGLIEIGNVCRNNCLYCGIRHDNIRCSRYLLSPDDILRCCSEGYSLGFRTFVLQGGERCGYTVEGICSVVSEIKEKFPDCAVTLSLGEYPRADYQAMFDSGADRYLLRHETADRQHYEMLHPPGMSFENRMRCLYDLKDIGYQTGCGFMVGSPGQTVQTIAKDLKFIENFSPEMCGIGPFIPHRDTPFKDEPPGSAGMTAYLLSLIRLIKPNVLLPSTTALNTISEDGRKIGILAGANVIMPNLSPAGEREKYSLYNGKLSSGAESAQNADRLKAEMKSIGYEVVVSRGDIENKEKYKI